MELMPHSLEVAVFDTAFHQTIPQIAYLYPVPYRYYEEYRIRKYGFHGTLHKYVSARATEIYGAGKEKLRVITCHLGNGASLCAVQGGRSLDATMGFTPLAGLMMGTRCRDIDPAIIPFLEEKEGLSPDQIREMLNKDSGVLGINGCRAALDMEPLIRFFSVSSVVKRLIAYSLQLTAIFKQCFEPVPSHYRLPVPQEKG